MRASPGQQLVPRGAPLGRHDAGSPSSCRRRPWPPGRAHLADGATDAHSHHAAGDDDASSHAGGSGDHRATGDAASLAGDPERRRADAVPGAATVGVGALVGGAGSCPGRVSAVSIVGVGGLFLFRSGCRYVREYFCLCPSVVLFFVRTHTCTLYPSFMYFYFRIRLIFWFSRIVHILRFFF